MPNDAHRRVIERYRTAYHGFNIDGMAALVHADIDLSNLSCGKIIALTGIS